MWIEARVDLGDLARQLADEASIKELVRFVKLLDDQVADWGLTRALRDYFNGIVEEEE